MQKTHVVVAGVDNPHISSSGLCFRIRKTMNYIPSIRSANWLYLLSMLLILTVGTFLQKTSFQWGLLGTEFFLILLPTILFLRANRLSLTGTLSLRWPGWEFY
ncbi:MAG: hypothetical protein HUU38_12500 [Anaerolineales bacterium]|nr:hypothetical protein [Anaerolineales bacterium]